MKTRMEKDSMGELTIPAEAYYGVQTQRAIDNFPISGWKAFPEFIRATLHIKRAAALANVALKVLDKKKGDAIIKAVDEMLSGKYHEDVRGGRVPGGRRHLLPHEYQRDPGQPRDRTAERQTR